MWKQETRLNVNSTLILRIEEFILAQQKFIANTFLVPPALAGVGHRYSFSVRVVVNISR